MHLTNKDINQLTNRMFLSVMACCAVILIFLFLGGRITWKDHGTVLVIMIMLVPWIVWAGLRHVVIITIRYLLVHKFNAKEIKHVADKKPNRTKAESLRINLIISVIVLFFIGFGIWLYFSRPNEGIVLAPVVACAFSLILPGVNIGANPTIVIYEEAIMIGSSAFLLNQIEWYKIEAKRNRCKFFIKRVKKPSQTIYFSKEQATQLEEALQEQESVMKG